MSVWWRHPFRMFQTNLREIDAGLDVESVADYIRDFGADSWLLSVGGIVSNYPTKLEFQTANPHLAERESGDLVGDAIRAATARGLRVLGRMDFSKIDHRRFERHPDWAFVNDRGETQVYSGFVSACPSGGYYQEKIFDVVAEVLSTYDIAGFFFNWMSFNEVDYSRRYWGVCQCLGCRRRFDDFAPGLPLPTDTTSPHYDVWQRFAYETLEDITARMRAHIRDLRPDAALILGDRADIMFHEANNAVGRPLWHHRTSEAASRATSLRPPTPVLVNSVGFLDMPYRLAGEDPRHFRQYLIQAIARGANPSTYIMGTPDDSPYECLEQAREITRFHAEHTATYDGLTSAARVLLIQPDPLSVPAAELDNATAEYHGWYLALLEEHVPFDVGAAQRLDDLSGYRDRYDLVVLPDLGPLPEAAVQGLHAFTAEGGRILCSGSSGLVGSSAQLPDSPVARRLASYDTPESTRSLVLTTADGPHRWGHPIPIVGAFHVVEPAAGTSEDLPSLSRAPYGPPEKCYGHLETAHPGRLTNEAETITVLPWTVGRVYREIGLRAAREVAVAEVRRLVPDAVVATTLPEQVEIVVGSSPRGIVLHLLNRSGDAVQRFVEPLTIPAATLDLRVDGPVGEVRALRSGRRVLVNPAGGSSEGRSKDQVVRLELPAIDSFEVVSVNLLDK